MKPKLLLQYNGPNGLTVTIMEGTDDAGARTITINAPRILDGWRTARCWHNQIVFVDLSVPGEKKTRKVA